MKPRHHGYLAAAAGALLGAVVLPAAVAFAYSYVNVPAGPLHDTFPSGGLPPIDYQVSGTQDFIVVDPTSQEVVGSFEAEVKNAYDIFGFTNQEIVVTGDVSGDAPPVESIFNTFDFGYGFELVYTDIAGTGPDAGATDVIMTPFGDIDVPPVIVEALGPEAFIPAIAYLGP
jgi:hypothetical protein